MSDFEFSTLAGYTLNVGLTKTGTEPARLDVSLVTTTWRSEERLLQDDQEDSQL